MVAFGQEAGGRCNVVRRRSGSTPSPGECRLRCFPADRCIPRACLRVMRAHANGTQCNGGPSPFNHTLAPGPSVYGVQSGSRRADVRLPQPLPRKLIQQAAWEFHGNKWPRTITFRQPLQTAAFVASLSFPKRTESCAPRCPLPVLVKHTAPGVIQVTPACPSLLTTGKSHHRCCGGTGWLLRARS